MMTTATLERILTAKGIPSRDWQAIKELTYNGTRPSNALLQRLRSIASYSAALSSILIELSKEVKYFYCLTCIDRA